MKKQLLNHYVFTAITLLYVNVSFATPTAPVRIMEVPAAYVAPTLDGVVDDVYSVEQSTSPIYYYDCEGEYCVGPDDFTAVFHLAYDLEFLYMIAIITDDIGEHYDTSYSEPWMFDNFEVFLQLDTNTTYTAYDDLSEQLRVCRGLDEIESDGEDGPWGFYMESTGGTGWISEVAIPWACAATGGTLPEDIHTYLDVMGFDFHGADSDNSDGDPTVGNRDYQTAWDEDEPDGMEDQAWQNVTVFGYITFEPRVEETTVHYTDGTINVYPNPGNNTLTFDVEGEQIIEIFSINGTKVFAGRTTGVVDISFLKNGLYVARIGKESVRFVKE